MTMVVGIAVAAASLGFAAAAFCLALYLGERGRRKDLAWLVDRERKEPAPVVVRESPDAEVEAIQSFVAIEKERLVEDLIRETGCTPEEARAEAERMIAQVPRLGSEPLF